jgi:hypothetical protein
MQVSAPFASRVLLCAALLAIPTAAVVAQAAGSDYTAAMPSVEKVKAQLQGTDATDTAARQVAVFEYLQVYIQRIKLNRDYRGPYSPAETKLLTDYAKAQFDLTNSFKKSHTPAEVATFNQLEGKYSLNNALDWIKQLEGQQAADTYKGTEASLAASQKAFNENIQQQMKQEQGGSSGSIAGDPVLDPMGIFARAEANRVNDPELRRCLELGGSLNACQGIGAMEGMASLLVPFAGKADANEPPPVAGLVLVGSYHSRTDLPELGLGAGDAVIHKCGTLVEDSHPYTIRRSGATTQIVVDNEPDPIVLTLRADGSLTGPGSIQVKGRVITGYTTTTSQVMVNGAPAAAQGYYCNGPCSTTSSVPNYAPSMQRCTISQLAAQPAPPPPPKQTGLIGAVSDMFGANDPAAVIYGFRLTGPYTSSTGMKLEFDNRNVTLDCGKAHVNVPYNVENTATGFIVHVQNGGGAFLLAVAPDNTLRGSGSTSVNGKLVSAINGDSVSFTPHSETCNVSTFAARSKRNTMLASNGPTPSLPASYSAPAAAAVSPAERDTAPVPVPSAAPVSTAPVPRSAPAPMEAALAGAGISGTSSASRAQLRVLLSADFTGTNPLAGQAVFVTRKPMDQILRELGVAVPAKATPAQAMKLLQAQCHAPQGCTSVIQGLSKYYVTTAKFDPSGKATLNATAVTGPYYFFAIVPDSAGSLVWDVLANLAAGDNTVTFSQSNSERIQ